MKITKFFLIVFLGLTAICGFVFLNYYSFQKKSSAAANKEVNFDTKKAVIKRQKKTKKINQFAYYGESDSTSDKKLYSFSNSQKKLGMAAFAGKNVEGLVDEETINQMKLKSKISSGSEHFYYEQNIDSIPVYGSHLAMHIDKAGEVYGIDGNLVVSETVPKAKITTEEAQEIALTEAKNELGQNNLYVYESEKYIYNKKIMGLGDDENNYLILVVWIKSEDNTFPLFSKKYFVDLSSKQILYSENKLVGSLNRIIQGMNSNGSVYDIRKEGEDSVSDGSANKAYKLLKESYDFYYSSFGLDSFDGNGTTLYGVVHLLSAYCPGAFFDTSDKKIYLCDSMIVNDIITHEIGHGVTGRKLGSSYQSGTLNESVSDIYGAGDDSGDWFLGEDTNINDVIRYMDDPTKAGDPDRLFSDHYYCGTSDSGGIHTNNGVFNKTFYLMSEGGSFNGCELTAVGMDKALQIVYRAVNIYMSLTGNFRSMYEAMVNSCNDLYGSGSSDCKNAIRAMQATEIDQQPSSTQTGAKCSGTTRVIPACVGNSSPIPTSVPTSSIAANTPTPITTQILLPTLTPLPTLAQSGNTTIELHLKFQGITSKPDDEYNSLRTKITLVSTDGDQFNSQADFIATSSGVFTGKAYFNFDDKDVDGKLFKILVKGPKHIQKKICDTTPIESKSGYYQCEKSNITLVKGSNEFDFSGIMLLSGDLPTQDGLINSYDLSLIRQYLGYSVSSVYNNVDVNLDGVVNTQDYSLVVFSLSTKFDE